jgi:hypothetical protein
MLRTLAIPFILLLPVLSAADGVPSAFTENPVVRDGKFVLWHDPGNVAALDFRYGIGGAELVPQPPFTFVEEDTSGTDAKIAVKDAKDRSWVIKFGPEASPDTFGSRLAWAAGYYVEPTYFVPEGVAVGAHGLKRADKYVDKDGHFRAGRFQIRSKEPKFLKYVNWAWDDNPFIGTPELNGLKILMMLLSNWDDKDARDADSRGTNTAIYQQGDLSFYFIDDWGGAMGNWGKFFTRSKWDSKHFLRQSDKFVTMKDGEIRWGYTGQHTALLTNGVSPADVKWLRRYLDRITDDQLRTGLLTSGATEEEAGDYLQGLRMRITALQNIP